MAQEQRWRESGEDVISWGDTNDYIGQVKTVEGRIVKTYKSKNAIFLDFHDPYQDYFKVVIWRDNRDNFSFNPESYYYMREVRVTDLIKEYRGAPEIVVKSPYQIEVAYERILGLNSSISFSSCDEG